MEIWANLAAVVVLIVAIVFVCRYEFKKEVARLAAGGLPREKPVYYNSGSNDIYPEYNTDGTPMIEGMGIDTSGHPYGTTGDD